MKSGGNTAALQDAIEKRALAMTATFWRAAVLGRFQNLARVTASGYNNMRRVIEAIARV